MKYQVVRSIFIRECVVIEAPTAQSAYLKARVTATGWTDERMTHGDIFVYEPESDTIVYSGPITTAPATALKGVSN